MLLKSVSTVIFPNNARTSSSKFTCTNQHLLMNIHGEGNGNPLQYPCLENRMDRGGWWAADHGVAKSQARLSTLIAAAESLQSCPTLCDPIDGSPPGSPVPGFLQARTLEWVAISFSNAWKWKVKVKSLSCVQLFATPWTAAYQAPPSMGFSRQEYWSGVPSPSPNTYYEHTNIRKQVSLAVNSGDLKGPFCLGLHCEEFFQVFPHPTTQQKKTDIFPTPGTSPCSMDVC